MARNVADPCRNCGAALAPGSAFCTLCGAAVPNRAVAPASGTVPLGAPGTHSQASLPGIIAVGITAPAPMVAPQSVGTDPRLLAGTVLVHGGAGRRLVAWLIDNVLPTILIGAAVIVGLIVMSGTATGGNTTPDFSWLLILTGIALLLSLGYRVWLWIWEAKAGKTPGNLMLGLRTTNMEGGSAGLLAIFLRTLIIGLGSILPCVGTLLVIISNAWDANGKRQGWHDKMANTLVFNVNAGRDPLETGGIAGRQSFTPAPMPAISRVNSPLPGAAPAGAPYSGPAVPPQPFAPSGQQVQQAQPFAPQSFAPQSFAPQVNRFAPPGQQSPAVEPITTIPLSTPQDDLEQTRVRSDAAGSGLRLTFDDGHTETVETVALVGRNPAGYDGEMIERLVSVQDSSRSVSKTHLHLQVAPEGLWVTDRNSTNGSAITNSAGHKSPMPGGVPQLAEIGAKVHFGDRSFLVGRA